MSDTTTMPFQSETLAEAPAAPEVGGSQGNKRVLVILAALVGLAVLGIAAYFLLFAGGSEDKATGVVAPAPQTAVQPSAAPSTAPKTAALPKISAKNFGTDPFKALISADTAVAGTAATGTAATGSTAPAGTTPSTTTPSSTTPSTTTPSTTTPVASQPYHFRVASVSDGNKTIDVRVNGKSYNGLKAGEVFAKIFKVRYIGGSVNAFQIGDEVFNVAGAKAVNISS